MKESTLKKNQAARIRQRGGFARSVPGGPQGAGFPDIVFVYRGYGGGIETKLPGKEGTLTELQAATLEAIRQAGGVGIMATTVKQVDELLDKLDRKKDIRLHQKGGGP